MIGFREYLKEQSNIDEGLVRKGAVTVYALQARRSGEEAVRHYQAARQALALNIRKDDEQKLDALSQAMASLADGLTATRQQIGSISAQLTASNL